MVTRLCVVHTGNFSDAEDCYQNVFFKLFKQMKKGSLPNPKAWLIRVALNECRSVLRYRLRKNTVDLSSITSFSKDGSDFEELSVQEIAELTKIKENTIKTHLKRGREQLKDMIML